MVLMFLLCNGILLDLKKHTLFAKFSMLCYAFYKLIK